MILLLILLNSCFIKRYKTNPSVCLGDYINLRVCLIFCWNAKICLNPNNYKVRVCLSGGLATTSRLAHSIVEATTWSFERTKRSGSSTAIPNIGGVPFKTYICNGNPNMPLSHKYSTSHFYYTIYIYIMDLTKG